MKWYNLVFFHIFKRYYKNGNYKSDIPWLTASVIISLSTYFYITNILRLFLLVTHHTLHIDKLLFILFGFIFCIINYIWFVGDKRYLQIYTDFKIKYANDRLTDIFSWIYIIVGFLSIGVIALLKVKLGE